jgi:DNA-binding response OmpR family regulator
MDTADMLRELGHVAIEAETGSDALQIAVHEKIDILLTDVGLTDISGVDLAGRVRTRQPELAIIFATGRDKIEGFDGMVRSALLRKPYQLDQLREAILAVVGGEQK